MTTVGKIDTCDLTMIIKLVIDITYWSPKFDWASVTHASQYIWKKTRKVTEKTNYILDTHSTKYTQQVFTHASRIFHIKWSIIIHTPYLARLFMVCFCNCSVVWKYDILYIFIEVETWQFGHFISFSPGGSNYIKRLHGRVCLCLSINACLGTLWTSPVKKD